MDITNYLFYKHKEEFHTIKLRDWEIEISQNSKFFAIGGPCAVESEEQILETAKLVKSQGANCLRAGCWKPRTDPHSWQGLGKEGFDLLYKAKKTCDIPIVTEILDAEDIDYIKNKVDIIQIGARNCQNYSLLRKVAKAGVPVLLKRGFGMRAEEYLMAAEYILDSGNKNVLLCERGIRYFDDISRSILDVNAIVYNRKFTILPTIIDSSHATGRSDFVIPVARAGVAAGGDGVIIEAHYRPLESFVDREQMLSIEFFGKLVRECKKIRKVYNNAE